MDFDRGWDEGNIEGEGRFGEQMKMKAEQYYFDCYM